VDDTHPDYYDGIPNSQALIEEVGQLLCCIDLLGLPSDLVGQAYERKREQLKVFGPDGTYLAEKKAKEREEPCG